MAGIGSGGDFSLEKSLPSNVDAERMILGVILLDNVTINQAVEHLKPDDFFLPSHRRIFDKMVKLYEGGQGIDPLTLQEELRRAGELDQVGGPAYIASLFDGVPRFSNIESYVKLVKGKGMLRKLIGASNQIMQMAFDDEEEPEEILDRAERLILAIAEDRIKQGFVHVGEVAEQQLHTIEELAAHQQLITGIATGFTDLDHMTSGLQRGDLVIIAARPSMGKCLAAGSEIVLADGRVATIEEIYHRREARLLTLSDDFKFNLTQPSAFVDDGVKPVYRVTTRLGRRLDSTITHPFLTVDGWKQLGELKAGDHVAVPRLIDVFGTAELSDGRIKLLAYLIGDGNLTNANTPFTNTNPRLQVDFAESLSDFPGMKLRSRVDGERAPSFYVASDGKAIALEREVFATKLRGLLAERGAARHLALELGVSPSLVHFWQRGECVPRRELFAQLCECLNVAPIELARHGLPAMSRSSRNPLTHWLEEIGLWGANSHRKFIPEIIFRLPKSQLALFLNRLFATDGWVALNEGQAPQIGYSTVSERMARQLQHLLLRVGVIAKLRKREIKYAGTRRSAWQLDVTHGDSIRAFAEQVGIFGKEDRLAQALTRLSAEDTRNNRDLIPMPIWAQIDRAKGVESWSSLARRAELKGHTNIHVGQRALSRRRLIAIAEALQNPHLDSLAHSQVYWDAITSIEYLGEQQVYDLTIPETHNFVANDICVHNTALALNIAQNAALGQDSSGRVHEDRQKAVVGIFSLEMSKEQLVQRLMCSQAQVDAHRLRNGMLNKDDWRRLALAVGELSLADIFLDDSPGITTLEIRAKARRLKNEQKRLDLLIIDYLQLMSGKGRTESRQQEVSQISRDLKILAKELNVPLIALSQLSRAPETRTGNHKPQLSDLRESGCLTGDTPIKLADGDDTYALMRDFIGKSDVAVLALNEKTERFERATVSNAFSTGVKPVLRLTTNLQRAIRATANHPLFTREGWRRLDEIKVGEDVAIRPRFSSQFQQKIKTGRAQITGDDILGRKPKTPATELGAQRMTTLAEMLLGVLGKSDIFWDKVLAIEPDGEEEVFDLTVEPHHNFLANDIVVHNSIEQDADVVMFIYREEVYKPETEKQNIAEIIVGKQRNGPTGSVDLVFRKALTRFHDISRETM